jgi:Protein of unknown function (DUF2917)
MDWGPTLTRTVDLGYEQMLVLESQPRTRIKVIYGGIWLTEENLKQDVFASSGEEVALKSRGLAVVEGLGYARVQVMEPPAGWRYWAGTARSALDSMTSWVRRLPALNRAPTQSQSAA